MALVFGPPLLVVCTAVEVRLDLCDEYATGDTTKLKEDNTSGTTLVRIENVVLYVVKYGSINK